MMTLSYSCIAGVIIEHRSTMVLVRVKVVCGGGLSGRVEGDGLWVACRRLLTHNIVKASICHEQRADGMNVE